MNNSFDNSITSNELINITSDLAEVGLDKLIEEGVLKDLPIVGTLVGLTKIGISIKDKLFLKKIIHFLYQLKDISSEKRQAFVDKINEDNKFKTKVGETVALIIDKINDYSKADYLGKLFAATINGKIDYSTFLKLSNIIDKCFIPDLNNLVPLYQGKTKEVDNTDKDILYNLGLLENLGINGKNFLWQKGEKIPNKKNEFEINKYGKLIVELLLPTDIHDS